MKIYLAAQYSRRLELLLYAADLTQIGDIVTARWLVGTHESADNDMSAWSRFAAEDLEDIWAAHAVISFTEPSGTGPSRGGRHVEFGLAMALDKRLIVVGHRENIFHSLPAVEFFPCWDEYLAALTAETETWIR